MIGTSEKGLLQCAEILLRHHLQARDGPVISSVAGRDDLVRRIATDKFDLIILFGATLLPSRDHVLPPLKNTVQTIFDITSRVSTPIITLSAMPESRSQWLVAGADAFLEMLPSVEEFAVTASRLLNNTEGLPKAEQPPSRSHEQEHTDMILHPITEIPLISLPRLKNDAAELKAFLRTSTFVSSPARLSTRQSVLRNACLSGPLIRRKSQTA